MPISDPGSYGPVMDEFVAHWDDVDAELGVGNVLKLQGGFGRANFVTLRGEVVAIVTEGEALENGRQIIAADRDNKKDLTRDQLGQFRAMVRAVLPKTKYAAALPVLPDRNASESRFLGPLDDGADVWGRINLDTTIPGFTPPLVIASLTQANFVANITALRTAFSGLATAENDLRIWIPRREEKLDEARERMIQYRAAVAAVLGENHSLTLSLPQIYPAPGSTPDPVPLTGGWNNATNQAEFNWPASTNPNLAEYELQRSSGSSFDPATATVIGNIPPGTTSFQTTNGLANSGDVASYRLFVRLTTGNEAGSNTVTITRP